MGPEATEICTFLVVKYGSLDDLRKLIERGAAVSGRTLFERSTLHFAAYHGRTEFIHLLLGAGVGAGHKDYQGLTAKEYATKNGFYETARWCWLGQFNYGRHGGVMMPKEDKKSSAGSNRSEKRPKMKEKVESAPVKSSQLPRQKSRKMVVNWLRESSEAIPNVEKTESVAKSDFVRGKNYERPSSTSRPRSSSKKQKAPKRVQLLAPAGAGEGSTEYRKTRFSRERPPELDEAVRRSQNNHLTVDPPPSRVRFPEENDEPEKTKKNFRKTKFSLNRPDGLDELVKSVDRTPEPKVSKGVCFASEDESEDERPEKSRFRKTKFSRNRPEGLDQLIEKTKKVEEPQVREEKGVSFMSEEQEEDQEKIKFRKTKFSLSRPEGIDEIVQNTKSEDPFFLTQNDDLSESDSENKKQRSISFADDEEDNNRSSRPKITIAEKPPSPQISIQTTPADSVDQFIKLETDKIKSNEIKEENSEPEVTFTEERFQQKDWVYRLSFLQSRNKEFTLPVSETREKTPEPKTELTDPEVSFRVSITPAAGESKLLDQRPSIPPTTLQGNNRQQRPTSSSTSNVPRPRPKLVQRAKTSHDLLEQERQKKEAEEKRRAEAEAAYQQWVKAKKNVKLRRLTPSPPPERDLKWYENKKRMFEPGSYSERPRPKTQPNSTQNSRPTPIYSEVHKPRKYDGNGIAFEEWLARKQNEQRSSNPNHQESQEETKKKNDEMRQMMAEEKFKEWLNKKLEQRQKATAQENKDRYEAHKRNTTSENQLSFDAWLEKKNDQQKQLQRVLRQIKREEQKRAEEERERRQQGLSFEDWIAVKSGKRLRYKFTHKAKIAKLTHSN
ncbi:Oidioi.mRNA.OKI2018_I69.PAR.g8721.t1.cds [Oikopleura dioica]|uniref:Oidioi.mRNA.OKI2018_I69.PAR.g8721.t1.cds n=1 Tax=Oikopleura dioica TaxID=34765 RepID=A0ABN7RLK6_OIKDI|nr:Oidioi.mRNA.OKI2018_I69.PAR.g8721.t1.cds [Oikopleura dioica]